MLKAISIVGAVLLSFFTGFMYSNYHWNGAIGTIMTVPEQSSVERALEYMELYLSGDAGSAHKIIEQHALSDPTWNLRTESNEDLLTRATDFPSFHAMEDIRVRQLEDIQSKQARIVKWIAEQYPPQIQSP